MQFETKAGRSSDISSSVVPPPKVDKKLTSTRDNPGIGQVYVVEKQGATVILGDRLFSGPSDTVEPNPSDAQRIAPSDQSSRSSTRVLDQTPIFVRDANGLQITSPPVIDSIDSDLLGHIDTDLAERVRKYLRRHKIWELSPVQKHALPVLLHLREGLVVTSPTASGKTFMYCLAAVVYVGQSSRFQRRMSDMHNKTEKSQRKVPECSDTTCSYCGLNMAVVRICPEKGVMHPETDEEGFRCLPPDDYARTSEPQVMILVPSRELVKQVRDILEPMTQGLMKVLWLTGNSTPEERALQQKRAGGECEIVVGTPTRLYRAWKKNDIKLNSVSLYLLDEADLLTEMTYMDAVRPFLNRAEATRALMGFITATLPRPSHEIMKSFFKQAQSPHVEICSEGILEGRRDYANPTAANAEFHVYLMSETEKTNYVLHVLQLATVTSQSRVIIFCNTARTSAFLTAELFSMLQNKNIRLYGTHGRKSNEMRDRALHQFQGAQGSSILVTTNLSSRGIDFLNVDHVILFDLPASIHEFIHRSGRAGRGMIRGHVHCFFVPEDRQLARPLVHYLKQYSSSSTIPLRLQEYANETDEEMWKRMFTTKAPGGRALKDRKRFETFRKPEYRKNSSKYPSPKPHGLKNQPNPRLFDLEHGGRDLSRTHPLRLRKTRFPRL